MTQLTVRPEILIWARDRVALDQSDLAKRVNVVERRVVDWETSGNLSFPQLERLAASTHTPIGYFFLPEPPEESLPIADFRTVADSVNDRPSPDLLDTIYNCQTQQAWYKDSLLRDGATPLAFVGSRSPSDRPTDVALAIRNELSLTSHDLTSAGDTSQAITMLVRKAEAAGITVLRNGVVGNNTSRKLDYREFRGFALSDEMAPLVFVNSTDYERARLFTLAHELGHIWLGESGVSDTSSTSTKHSERFCNEVAAEVLVPERDMRLAWRDTEDPAANVRRIATRFKVSQAVISLRALTLSLVNPDVFRDLFALRESYPAPASTGSGTGGDFYNNLMSRLGRPFIETVIVSALEGRETYSEAFRLLGLKGGKAFDGLTKRLGVMR